MSVQSLAVVFLLAVPSHPIDMDVLAKIESNHNPKAVSKAGARGLYQIMPPTWDEHAKSNERWDCPKDNKAVAERYIRWISRTLKRWGDTDWDKPDHILACYNGGIGRFRRAEFKVNRMPAETRNFVRKYRQNIKHE